MTIFAIADLHLSFGTPGKEMDLFGDTWRSWTKKIEQNWRERVTNDDLVLLPGDLSWAMHLEEAKIDLMWIDALPGEKVIIRGNHDYWYSSATKVRKALPPSMHLVHNDVFLWEGVEIAGTRLWDSPDYSFGEYIEFVENPKAKVDLEKRADSDQMEKIYRRELHRLELSLQKLKGKRRMAMTHYPPIGADLKPSDASKLFEKYGVETVVFGHLHSLKKDVQMFGETNGVTYILTSCDYLNFCPVKIT